MTEQAAAGLNSGTGEAAGARWLDAEDAAVQQALAWALEHDAPTALRLAVALAPWWRLRGRSAEGRVLLQRATKVSGQHYRSWFAAQVGLGYPAQVRSDFAAALGHFTAACDAPDPPSRELVHGLAGRSGTLRNLGRPSEATKDAQRALRLARQIGYPAGEVMALIQLSAAADYAGDAAAGLEWARLAQQVPP